jgi:hypothetical protein
MEISVDKNMLKFFKIGIILYIQAEVKLGKNGEPWNRNTVLNYQITKG